ncbi:hypothetical protein [Gimesia aquarii]|nr:hypothetical protein [Gimesia aquarii]
MTKMLSDWNARQKIADSMLYEIRGHVIVPRDSYLRIDENQGVTPIHDSEYNVSTELLLDFQNNRVRRTEESEVLCAPIRSFIPYYEVDLYDGTQYFNYQPIDKNTSDSWKPGKYQSELHLTGSRPYGMFFSHYIDILLLTGHGSIYTHNSPVTPQKLLRTSVTSHFFKQELVKYKGRQCILLQTMPSKLRGKGYYNIIVDPAHESAIVKWSSFYRDQLYSDIEIEHELTKQGWLPARWTETYYSKPKIPITKTMCVKRRVFNPKLKDSDFKIEITPGMVIYDRATNSEFISSGPGKPMIPLKEWKLKHPDE